MAVCVVVAAVTCRICKLKLLHYVLLTIDYLLLLLVLPLGVVVSVLVVVVVVVGESSKCSNANS